jgi:hypothetical protein
MVVALYVEKGAVNGSAQRTTRTNATSLLNTAEALTAALMPIRPQSRIPDLLSKSLETLERDGQQWNNNVRERVYSNICV